MVDGGKYQCCQTELGKYIQKFMQTSKVSCLNMQGQTVWYISYIVWVSVQGKKNILQCWGMAWVLAISTRKKNKKKKHLCILCSIHVTRAFQRSFNCHLEMAFCANFSYEFSIIPRSLHYQTSRHLLSLPFRNTQHLQLILKVCHLEFSRVLKLNVFYGWPGATLYSLSW